MSAAVSLPLPVQSETRLTAEVDYPVGWPSKSIRRQLRGRPGWFKRIVFGALRRADRVLAIDDAGEVPIFIGDLSPETRAAAQRLGWSGRRRTFGLGRDVPGYGVARALLDELCWARPETVTVLALSCHAPRPMLVTLPRT